MWNSGPRVAQQNVGTPSASRNLARLALAKALDLALALALALAVAMAMALALALALTLAQHFEQTSSNFHVRANHATRASFKLNASTGCRTKPQCKMSVATIAVPSDWTHCILTPQLALPVAHLKPPSNLT